MDITLNTLKRNFNELIELKYTIMSLFDDLGLKTSVLKKMYTDLIKTNQEQVFIFSLDSFHFQNRYIDIEYEDLKRLFNALNNRIYCDYYKLCKLIIHYMIENITEIKTVEISKLDMFPQYKDLEPFKKYDVKCVQDVHENVITLLSSINDYVVVKQDILNVYKKKRETGLNIDNFIISFNYNIFVVNEKLNTFTDYLSFFHRLHIKYLKRLTKKVKVMYTEITSDIKFENVLEKNKKNLDYISDEDENENVNETFDEDIIVDDKQITINNDTTVLNKNNISDISQEHMEIETSVKKDIEDCISEDSDHSNIILREQVFSDIGIKDNTQDNTQINIINEEFIMDEIHDLVTQIEHYEKKSHL
jgi:hypothetical protein